MARSPAALRNPDPKSISIQDCSMQHAGHTPSARSSMLMLPNCSTSSMMSFCLLILTTRAALPALRRANRNLRRVALSSCGMSTVWDYDREPYHTLSQTVVSGPNAMPTMLYVAGSGVELEGGCRK